MPVKNEQLNFVIITILLFAALAIIFLVLRPESLSSFLPYLFLTAPLIFLIAFVNTDVALVLLIFSMLLSPELVLGAVKGRSVVLRLDDIFIFLVFSGWLAKMAINKEFGLLKATPLSKPILSYILVCIVATCIGILRGTTVAQNSVFYILKYLEYFVFFFMVANNIRSERQVKIFLFFMLVTCIIVGIFGLYISFAQGIRATAPFEGGKGEANTLAGYLMIMMSIAAGVLLYQKDFKTKLFLAGFIGFTIWPFLYTYSRSGLFGFFAAYFLIIFFSKRHKIPLILFFIIFALIAPRIFQKPIFWRARQAFTRGSRYELLGERVTLDESAAERIKSWHSAIRTWKKNPILGEGVASGKVLHEVQYARVIREVGLVGSIAFLWMLVVLCQVGWKVFKNTRLNPFNRGLALGYFSSLIGLIIMGVGAEVFIIIRIMEPFWFLTAIIVNLPEINKAPASIETLKKYHAT